MEKWPTEVLPDASLDFSGVNETNAVRTSMASGRIRQRRRFSLDLKTVNVRWRFTDGEYALFQSFIYYKISGGSDWFEIDLLMGDGLKTYKARFVEGRYSYTLEHPSWVVTGTLEIEEQQYLAEDIFDASLTIGSIEDLEAAAAHLDHFVNVTVPATPTFQA